MRSDQIKKGIERAPHRALLKATGVTDAIMGKPFIAIVNSYVDIVPGHVHLQEFGKLVKDAVRAAGGVPFEFNTIGVDDGIAMGHVGMKYSLPSRELIADCVETMIEAHRFDGMVCIPNCDKIVPGMLMAAMRVNIPAIFVSGGPMAAGRTPDGQAIDLISVFEGVGAYQAGKIDAQRLKTAGRFRLPVLRLLLRHVHRQQHELPDGSPRPGPALQRLGAGAHPGTREPWPGAPARRSWSWSRSRSPRARSSPPEALDDAFALDMAMGGSTNTVLHALAIAHEAGIEYPLAAHQRRRRPSAHICQGQPVRALAHGRRAPRRRRPRHPERSLAQRRGIAPGPHHRHREELCERPLAAPRSRMRR